MKKNSFRVMAHSAAAIDPVWRAALQCKFNVQEGVGRPFSKGTGAPVSDPSSPLLFPRNVNRISAPDANACFGCHNVLFPARAGIA